MRWNHAFTDKTFVLPLCSKCKWFIPSLNGNPEYGSCKIFSHFEYTKEKTVETNEYAVHCRNNKYQCGSEGYLFEPSLKLPKKCYHLLKDNDLRELEEKKKELEDEMCGEVHEKSDLEAWDKEYALLTEQISTFSTFRKGEVKNLRES